MSTTTARTVFVLGREQDGNREMLIVDSGAEYSINYNTNHGYSDDPTTQFPYEL